MVIYTVSFHTLLHHSRVIVECIYSRCVLNLFLQKVQGKFVSWSALSINFGNTGVLNLFSWLPIKLRAFSIPSFFPAPEASLPAVLEVPLSRWSIGHSTPYVIE